MKIIFITIFFLFTNTSFADSKYFPEKTFSDKKESDDFVRNWYSGHLASMNEKPLIEYSQEIVFRFTWLPTFHAPMAFRLVKNDDGKYVLYTKRTNGAGGYDAGKLDYNEEISMSNAEAIKLLEKIESDCDFWKTSTLEKQMGLDGSQWIFEYKKSQQYHVVDRWSPEKGCLYEVGRKLMRTSKAKIREIY